MLSSCGLALVALSLQAMVSWISTQANCDDSSCPIMCVSSTCPAAGAGYVQMVEPIAADTSCQEVIVQSPGYPNGYPAGDCEWRFDTVANTKSTTMVTVLDFDGEPEDTILQVDAILQDLEVVPLIMGDSDSLTGCSCSGPMMYFSDERGSIALIVRFNPGGIFPQRGFKIRINFSEWASGAACTATEVVALSDAFTVGVIHSPKYPRIYPDDSECYYTVTSPADTQIVIDFLAPLVIRSREDYLFIYDNSGDSPELLRLFSHSPSNDRFTRKIRTGTNDLRAAFKSYDGQRRLGFLCRLTFEALTAECSGRGTLTTQCDCSGTSTGGPRCEATGVEDYSQYPADPDVGDLTSTECGDATFTFTNDASNANALLASPYYFSGSGAPARCRWTFTGKPSHKYALIIRDLDSEVKNADVVNISATVLDDENPTLLRYSMPSDGIFDVPFARDSTTFPLLGTPIIVESSEFAITYSDMTADNSVRRGILFEVHLLDEGVCTEPCLNGGPCTGYCDCDAGYQGERCEQTIPPDYTCIVKNPYISPHFAYPVQIYAIAGTNVFASDRFDFDVYGRTSKSRGNRLPASAKVHEESYGNVLSLPASCDKKHSVGSRFGAISCIFEGNDWLERCDIPAIVNPASELIRPIGRFTKTVSVEDKSVSLSVEYSGVSEDSIRWRVNGLVRQKWNGRSTIEIEDVKLEDAGVYEAFIHGEGKNEYDVVTYRLIVRKCPAGFHGFPGCAGVCPDCKNGGTCSAELGTCVCPPGYSGDTCNKFLTGSTVGRNPALTCPGLGITYDGCKFVQMCLPDPGGCMCMSGWTGPSCDVACQPLKFGLECQFDCHCSGGAQCDVATGKCPGACATSYGGPNCQE